jgi:hypothetical protein
VLGEYQDLEWEISPYRAWRGEVQYVSALSETTDVYATASYLNRYFPHGTSGSFNTSGPLGVSGRPGMAFTEQAESTSASIQKRLLTWHMSVAAGGSYTHLHGLIDTNAYALNASWTWSIGRMQLSVGASGYASDSSGENTLSTRRDHELVYLNLRRRLF